MRSIQMNKNRDNVLVDGEVNDCVLDLSASPKNIGWNIEASTNLQVNHKQITERFVELLGLFEEYSKIVQKSEHVQPKLRRSQSEQCIAVRLQPAETGSSELVRGAISLTRLQLSDSTLIATPRKPTCEIGIQTNYPIVVAAKNPPKQVKNKQIQQFDQHTLHIEVESIDSITALERAPLRQRMYQVLVEVGRTLESCFTMMGENITYVLFVLLCIWCLYLIIEHYSSFLGGKKVLETK